MLSVSNQSTEGFLTVSAKIVYIFVKTVSCADPNINFFKIYRFQVLQSPQNFPARDRLATLRLQFRGTILVI